jgi:hypothetical protein
MAHNPMEFLHTIRHFYEATGDIEFMRDIPKDGEDEKIVHVYNSNREEIPMDSVKESMAVYLQVINKHSSEVTMNLVIVDDLVEDRLIVRVINSNPVYDVYKMQDGKFVSIEKCTEDPDSILCDPSVPFEKRINDGDLIKLTYAETDVAPDDKKYDDPTGLYICLIHPEDIDLFEDTDYDDDEDDDDDEDEDEPVNEPSLLSACKYITFIDAYHDTVMAYRETLSKAINAYNAQEDD